MPIRTLTIEQAARNFVVQYRLHFAGGDSVVGLFDPRKCRNCMRAFDDLIFALDDKPLEIETARFTQDNFEGNIIDLFQGTE